MELTAIITEAWGWKGIRPKAVINQNSFGNLIVIDEDGQYWRVTPEHLECSIIANDDGGFRQLWANAEFQRDWHMALVCDKAHQTLGPPGEGRCYCLKIPAVLGGAYDVANIGTISVNELIAFAGNLARQIEDIPDGAHVELKVVE